MIVVNLLNIAFNWQETLVLQRVCLAILPIVQMKQRPFQCLGFVGERDVLVSIWEICFSTRNIPTNSSFYLYNAQLVSNSI